MGYLQLGEGSTASLSNATARNSVSYGQQVPRSVFEAKANSTLNLSQVALERINPSSSALVRPGQGRSAESMPPST